jgi:hypothetical protein
MLTAPVETESTDPKSCARAAEHDAPVNVESGPASVTPLEAAGELELLHATRKSAATKTLFMKEEYEHFGNRADDLEVSSWVKF